LASLVFAALWLSLLGLSSLAPPIDNIEQLTWVRSLEWGYYKHPPLPTWLLWPVVQLLGLRPLATYLLGASITLGALGLAAHLLVLMRGPRFAATAFLAMLCITFYNGRLYYYNHNTVLFLFVIGSAWASWQAFSRRSLGWWAVVGVMLGLGGLSKYQIVVAAASVAVLWVQQRAWRDPVHVAGVALATVLSLLIVLPHAVWLVQNDFAPIHYAMNSSLGAHIAQQQRPALVSNWLIDLLFNRLLPAWLLLLFALTGRRAPASGPADRPLDTRPDSPLQSQPLEHRQLSRALLLSFGGVPLASLATMGLLGGVQLQLQWGTAFAALMVPAVMELLAGCGLVFSKQVLWRAAKAFLVLQALLFSFNGLTSPLGPARWQSSHWCRFNSADLAQVIAEPARQIAGEPIRIVEGPANYAGALALALPERPKVLIDGKLAISPWLSSDALLRCNRLQLDRTVGPHDASWRAAGPKFPDIFWRVLKPANTDKSCAD
jgi:4-amino-4-deoxy-L-arabinose transferase-like glycosyltransferase